MFLRELLRHLRGHVIVVLDNSSTHKEAPLQRLLRQHSRLHIKHFPSYAHRTESALVIPEKAKGPSTPKSLRHVIPFAFFDVGFRGRIIRVGFAFDFNVSLNGYATGEQQPQLLPLPFFITGLPEEDLIPVLMPLKISLFKPVRALFSHVFFVPIATAYRRLSNPRDRTYAYSLHAGGNLPNPVFWG